MAYLDSLGNKREGKETLSDFQNSVIVAYMDKVEFTYFLWYYLEGKTSGLISKGKVAQQWSRLPQEMLDSLIVSCCTRQGAELEDQPQILCDNMNANFNIKNKCTSRTMPSNYLDSNTACDTHPQRNKCM